MNPINDITIYNPFGSAYISDGGSSTLFPISNSCERTSKVMGEDSVRLVFNLTHKVTFDAFSFIEYNGQAFFLKEQYIPKPIGGKEVGGVVQSARYSYDVKFVSVANMLDKFICYRHVVVGDNSWNEPEININGTLETLYVIIMGAIQQAASRLDPAMFFTAVLSSIATNGLTTSGGVIVPNTSVIRLTQGTELLTFNFSGDNIANVCTTVANNFTNDDKKDTEWYITPVDTATFNTCALHFAKCVDEDGGSVRIMTDYVVERDGEYLDGKLKSVEYTQAWSGIPEVIVPYGSDRNMSYYSVKAIDEVTRMQSTFGKRLRLKPNKVGTDAYQFTDKDGNPVSIETDANGAIRNRFVNTGIEVVKFFDEIYPQCHFKVTSVAEKSKRQDGQIVPEYTIEAEPIDRDGNPLNREDLTNNGFYPIQIEEATTLSVRFESGLLNGREFEIANKTRKDEGATTYSMKFTIVADGSIEDGTLIPSGNFKPRAEGNGYEGDKFALFNMKMPEEYVTYAELELAKRAYEELIELQSSRPEIKCVTDDTVFNEDIKLGDVIIVRSELFNSADVFKSRVISYSYKLTQPREVTFNLASAIMQGTLSSMNDLIADVTHTAGGLDQRTLNLSRRGWRDASEVASMLDSLTSDVVLVGNGRYQFGYAHEGQGVEIINETVGGNTRTTKIKVSHGSIEHTQEPYVNWVSKGFWEVSAVTITNAVTEGGGMALVDIPDTPCYLYAVVNDSDNLLTIELTSIAHDADTDEDYLLMGILSSEFEGRRVFSRTNGYTAIEGGTITTEIIQDAGRNLIIDFQSNPPRIIARNGAEIVGNIKFLSAVDENGNDVLKTLESLGFDVSGLQNDVNNVKYVDISNATNISLTIRSQVMNLSDVAVKLASSRYKMKFQKGSEIVLSPFSTSCIAIVEKGQNVSHSTVIDLVKWGEEYTPTTEVDAYLLPADKGYFIEYAFPNQHDHIEYKMKEVWTTNNVQVLVESGDYLKMLQAEMSAKEESTMEAIAGLKDIQDSLQSQIDGEVTSWFYDKAPVDTSDNVLADIEPMSEWLKNYTFENGVYTLKSGERNELVNHIGDTYTNMEEYKVDDQGNTTTPLAGLSWRWCDATTVNPLPSKYITIRYSQNGSVVEKRLHWHKIADSDAVKALQEAGRAQATADGKSTIFTTQPSNYSVGDMWILMEDTRVGGTLYQKGTVLNANNDSVVFNYAHWSEDVKYIDESVAAKKAQEALDNLELGGTNLLTGSRTGEGWSAYTSFEDGVYYSENNTSGEKYIYSPKNLKLSKGTYTLSFDFKTDGFKEYSGRNNEGVQLFFLDGDFSPMNNHRIQYADISTNWKHYIWTFEVEEDCSGDAYIRFDNDRTSSYTNPTKLWVKDVKLEKGNKATGWSPAPEDVDSKADAIRAIANEALTDAEAAMKNLDDMSSDSILTPQEKVSVANEWKCIQKEYQQNTTNATSIGMLSDTAYTTYKDKYDALATYVSGLALSTKSNTTIVQSTFQSKFSEYYSANVAFLNALADKVAKLEVDKVEIGGRNLLRYTDQSMYFSKFTAWQSSLIDLVDGWIKVEQNATATTSGVITDKNSDVSLLEKQKSYILSFDAYLDDSATTDTLILNYNYLMSSGGNFAINKSVNITKKPARYSIEFTYNGTTTQNFGAMVGSSKISCPIFYVKNIKLERGNKPTDWTPAPEDVDAKVSALDYLKAALTDGSTEISGGLTMTNVLMLKNLAGDVTAGMSGLTTHENKEDKVLMWGGGTYEEAYAAANSENYYKSGTTPITTLLKKDGTGKIGIFKISETQAVVNVPNLGEVVIDAVNGVSVKDKSKVVKALVTPKTMSEAENDIKSATFVNAEINVNNTYNLSTNGLECSKVLWSNPSAPDLSVINGTLRVTAKFKIDLSINSTDNHWIRMIVSLGGAYGFQGMTGCLDITSPMFCLGYFGGEDDRLITLTADCTFTNAEAAMLDEIRVHATMYAEDIYHEIIDPTYSFETNVEISAEIELTTDEKINNSQYSIMAKDGFLSMSGKKMFKVLNGSGGTQKIFAKGLSGAKGDIGSGELYISSDFIQAFRELCDVLEDFFPLARTIGSNATNAEQCVKKVQAVRNALKTTSIIASS